MLLRARVLTAHRPALEVADVSPRALHVGVQIESGGRRDGQREQDTRDGRMDPGLEDSEPERDAQHRVYRGTANAYAIRGHEQTQDGRGSARGGQGKIRCVEDGDDQHGQQVVDDREGGHEDAQSERCSLAEQGEDAEREGDVRRHRDAPAGSPRAASGDSEEDRGRHDGASHGGCDRQRRPACGGELADQDLALDLEADDEEEDGHEPVVDPVDQRVGKGQITKSEPKVRRPRSTYEPAAGEFAQTSATAAAAMRRSPPDALVRANSRNGARRRSTG